MHRTASLVRDVDAHLHAYRFSEAALSIYNFILYDLCDVYVEQSKPILYKHFATPERIQEVMSGHNLRLCRGVLSKLQL